MAFLWDTLIGRARPASARRLGAKLGPRRVEPGPPRQYLAVVARERPDMLVRVNRLFCSDGNVEAILDRRHGERRRTTARIAPDERRRVDRRRAPRPEADLALGLVVIAEARSPAVPDGLIRWMAAGRDALGALDRVLDDVGALRRQCEALRATVHRLQAENQALRARDAAVSRELAGLAEEIARPLGEILHRLRAG